MAHLARPISHGPSRMAHLARPILPILPISHGPSCTAHLARPISCSLETRPLALPALPSTALLISRSQSHMAHLTWPRFLAQSRLVYPVALPILHGPCLSSHLLRSTAWPISCGLHLTWSHPAHLTQFAQSCPALPHPPALPIHYFFLSLT
jgi:hypothetical protein